MPHKYITTDVEVWLDEWDTGDLIEEIRDRAISGDEVAQKFLGLEHREQQEEILSAAGILSNRIISGETRVMLQAVVNAPGYGICAIENAYKALCNV